MNWKQIPLSKIAEYCESFRDRYGECPSVRDIFYRFVDEFWPNTKNAYKGLSKWLVRKRLEREIDWRLIRDGSGREIYEGDYVEKDPESFVKGQVSSFINSWNAYRLPVWSGQPKRVVVACEKEADYPVVNSIVGDLNVNTFYERGYSGWRPLFEIAENIEQSGKQLVIIALGDFDPSGEDIVRFLGRAMNDLKIEVIPEKVAVTKKQIERFKLPHRPEDAKEIEKLRKDPRFRKWPWGLYRVETAALRAKAPDYFDKLLKKAVMKHFDLSIHEEVSKREEAEREIVKKRIGELTEKIIGDEE